MAEQVRRACQLAMAFGLAVMLVIGVAACGDDSSDDLPPPASPDSGQAPTTPAETLDPRDAEAWEEIQAKFDGLMETWIKWAAEGSPGGFENPATAEIGEYAAGFFYDEVSAELAQETQDGHVRTGRPEWRDAQLLSVDWDGEVPEAVFEVCVDDSEWVVIDAETREPVTESPGSAHPWTMTARWAEDVEFGPEGWALFQRELNRSQSC